MKSEHKKYFLEQQQEFTEVRETELRLRNQHQWLVNLSFKISTVFCLLHLKVFNNQEKTFSKIMYALSFTQQNHFKKSIPKLC